MEPVQASRSFRLLCSPSVVSALYSFYHACVPLFQSRFDLRTIHLNHVNCGAIDPRFQSVGADFINLLATGLHAVAVQGFKISKFGILKQRDTSQQKNGPCFPILHRSLTFASIRSLGLLFHCCQFRCAEVLERESSRIRGTSEDQSESLCRRRPAWAS